MRRSQSAAKPPSGLRQSRDGIAQKDETKPVPWHLWEYIPAEDITVHHKMIVTVDKPLDTLHGAWLSEDQHNALLEDENIMIRRVK